MLDLRTLSSLTDFFVICTAMSSPQIAALRESIKESLNKQQCRVRHVEGSAAGAAPNEPQWVLIDCEDVVVHLLDERARDFYRLEQLWGDAPRVPIKAEPKAKADIKKHKTRTSS